MDFVPFGLMLKDTRVRLAELSLIERLAEFLRRFLHLLVHLLFNLRQIFFYQHVRAITLLRVLIVYQRVIEGIHMAGCLPDSRMHKDGGIQSHYILVQERHTVPPVFLDIVFQFYAILTVVVHSAQTVVNFGGREYETVFFAM